MLKFKKVFRFKLDEEDEKMKKIEEKGFVVVMIMCLQKTPG